MLLEIRLDDALITTEPGILERLGDLILEGCRASPVDFRLAGQFDRHHLRPRRTFDRVQQAALPRRNEENRRARAARAPRTTDPVHVALCICRYVEVHHVGNAVDIDTARRNVGGDENIDRAALQTRNGRFPLRLREVAVDGGCRMATGFEPASEVLARKLGAHENDDAIRVLYLEDAGQCIKLVRAGNNPELLLDAFDGRSLRLDADLGRVLEIGIGHALYGVRHGCREQRHLSRIGRVLEDPLHVFDEAHAQHLVRFVEDHRTKCVELERASPQMVHDAAGRADDHLRATAQLLELNTHALAAIDRKHVETADAARIVLESLRHLDRELTGRRKHEHLRS